MIVFLLKSTACMAVFLAFYKLLLEKGSNHFFKRFYLMGALIVSFIIPNIVFTEYSEIAPGQMVREMPLTNFPAEEPVAAYSTDQPKINWELLLWSLYGIGVLGFGFRFLRHLLQIRSRIVRNPKLRKNRITKVLLQEPLPPHTFFNYVFLNEHEYETNRIPEEVLLHEETHAKQKHSADVLFIELVQVLFWFNPLLQVLKRAIKLNHEFLADRAVIQSGVPTGDYQSLLLAFSSPNGYQDALSPPLANPINYSSIKKRMSVMKTRTSKKAILLRTMLLLPILALMLYGFSETKVLRKNAMELKDDAVEDGGDIHPEAVILKSQQLTPSESNKQKAVDTQQIRKYNTLAKKYNAIPIEKRIIPLTDLQLLETIYRSMNDAEKENAQPFPECPNQIQSEQEGASSQQVQEYNAMAKKYNTMIKKGTIWIKQSEVDNMNTIYSLMTNTQKEKAEPYPDFPKPPPAPTAPRAPNTVDYASKVIGKIIEVQDPYDGLNPPANVSINKSHITEPPVPSSPKSPLDHVIEMAKQGAIFYYKDKEITSDKAIDIIKKNSKILIKTSDSKSDKPIVKISAVDNKTTINNPEPRVPLALQGSSTNHKNLFIGPMIPPTPNPNPEAYIKELAEKGAIFYIGPHKYSSEEAIELVRKSSKEITIDVSQYPEVRLGGC